MRQTYSISFYCRESKVSKKTGLAPVELSMSINGTRCYIALPRKETPTAFKKAIGSKRGNDIKEFCNIYYSRANTAILSLLRDGNDLDVGVIKARMMGVEQKKKTVNEFWNEFLQHLTKRVDVDIQLSTFQKYLTAKEYFIGMFGDSVAINEINADMLNDMYLRLKKEKSINTAEKYMTRIKSCFLWHKMGEVFDGIKLVKEKKEIVLFSDADYETIKNKVFQYEALNRMRDLFVFATNSGLSYSDIMSLERCDFNVDDDGNVTIVKQRHKTGVTFYSVVLPDGVEVLKKYDYQLPRISNQKGNLLLHTMQGICDITAPLTFHKCRHYYCSRLIKAGVDATVVQKCMGHSTIKMTIGTYTHLVEDDVKSGVLSKIK